MYFLCEREQEEAFVQDVCVSNCDSGYSLFGGRKLSQSQYTEDYFYSRNIRQLIALDLTYASQIPFGFCVYDLNKV